MAYFNQEARSQQLNAEISSKYQGTARIYLDSLFFDPERDSGKKKTNRLIKIFKREGYDRLNAGHAIPGTIIADWLSASLQQAFLSTADLRSPEPPLLSLPTGVYIHYIHGKHRIEALRQSKGLSP
ncbi:hypothetical protein F4808DRAFT_142025 [Astrocystis sublimbata]|nr:hypothetical protein F4808DRAFT_142025 [Astrocystis sublimbata]